jgi:ABC-type nickel/cobalt efflux system permease component RcnA
MFSNSVIPIVLFISRSKLVPDFGLTIHLLHLIVTTIYTRSFSTNLLWWALQAASSALMVSVGVWACRYRELRPITFSGHSTATATATASQKPADGSADLEDHVRGGRGRGRNRDEGPSYEMVGIKTGDEAA